MYARFVPIASCALGALCAIGGLVLMITSRSLAGLPLLVMGAILIAMFARYRRRFGIVTTDSAGITVEQEGAKHSFAWRDVASFRTIPFVTPPIYRLAFRSNDLVTYFIPPTSASLSLGFWTYHHSGMGKFIHEQLKQTGGASVCNPR